MVLQQTTRRNRLMLPPPPTTYEWCHSLLPTTQTVTVVVVVWQRRVALTTCGYVPEHRCHATSSYRACTRPIRRIHQPPPTAATLPPHPVPTMGVTFPTPA